MPEKTTIKEKFQWERPDQRLHHRVSAPIKVKINGKNYNTEDWSISGFKLVDFPHAMKPGERFKAGFALPFRDLNIQFEAEAEVIEHHDDDSKLRAKFVDLDERHKELLEYFVQCLITGQMADIEDTIKRVDFPITPISDLPDVNPKDQLPLWRRSIKSLFIGLAYLVLGGALLAYVVSTLYSHFFLLVIESAVISDPIEVVQAPISGILDKVYVEVGSKIQAGKPLLRIKNSGLLEVVEFSQSRVDDAKLKLAEQQRLLAAEKKQLLIYKKIGNALLKAEKAKIQEIEKKIEFAKTQWARLRRLQTKGAVSQLKREEAEYAYKIALEELKVAKSKYKVAYDGLSAIKIGRFFSRGQLEGKVPELETAVFVAKRRLQLEREKLTAARTHIKKLVFMAPFDGRLVKVLKSTGNTIKDGDPLVLIERFDERVIDAYLTQEEVTQVKLDSEEKAYIPALDRFQMVRVDKIDRTTGFIDDIQSRFHWRGPRERSAYVKLVIEGMEAEEIRTTFPAGTPVVIYFHKTWANEWWHNVKNTYQDWDRAKTCSSVLWPSNSFLVSKPDEVLTEELRLHITQQADKALNFPPAPVQKLHSAGIKNKKDPQLLASRRAFKDADYAAILALAYSLTGSSAYLDHAKQILLSWAEINQPTGHPIDETRLEGLLWAYDFLKCHLNSTETAKFQSWLKTLQQKKRAWKFGSITKHNNHYTHQVKMLLLLDKLLGDSKGWQQDVKKAQQHARVNILSNGSSIDYKERDALYYHVYDLEAWIEIALISDCCQIAVRKAFNFLQERLKAGDIHHEFSKSKARIDAERGAAGFAYAKKGGTYDVSRTTRAILSYNTLVDGHTNLASASPQQLRRNLFYYARYFLWQTP
jgi:multidrug resistance efflux pump